MFKGQQSESKLRFMAFQYGKIASRLSTLNIGAFVGLPRPIWLIDLAFFVGFLCGFLEDFF